MAAQEMQKLQVRTTEVDGDVSKLKAEVKELKEMKEAFAKELGELKREVEELKKFKELYSKELTTTVAKEPTKGPEPGPESKRITKLPIQLHDFTGEKTTPYLAEEALRWLRKLRIAARENEWDETQTLEMASIHLKGRAARWFEFVEEELLAALSTGDRSGWWNLFEIQFKERFADFDPPHTSARMLRTQRMKEMALERGQDVRDHAEAFASENRRLNPPITDPYLAREFQASLGMKRLHLYLTSDRPFMEVVEVAQRFQIEQSLNHRFQMDPSLSHAR